MSTYCYQLRFNLMLHNQHLKGIGEDDVITAFQRQSILEYLFRNFHQDIFPTSG